MMKIIITNILLCFSGLILSQSTYYGYEKVGKDTTEKITHIMKYDSVGNLIEEQFKDYRWSYATRSENVNYEYKENKLYKKIYSNGKEDPFLIKVYSYDELNRIKILKFINKVTGLHDTLETWVSEEKYFYDKSGKLKKTKSSSGLKYKYVYEADSTIIYLKRNKKAEVFKVLWSFINGTEKEVREKHTGYLIVKKFKNNILFEEKVIYDKGSNFSKVERVYRKVK